MLEYIGPRLSTGEIERSLIYSGIPALDEIDEATLTPEQIEKAIESGLYRHKGASPTPPAPPKKAKTAKKPKAAGEANPPGGDAPTSDPPETNEDEPDDDQVDDPADAGTEE